jgi:hypothetical protein
MLLWINGPFGGGKSTTARELHRRLPGSLICDPELLGLGLHRMMPPQFRGDFQDFPAWRQGVYEVLDLILRSADGTVIAPMTLIEPAYFADIIGRLADAGHDVRHFSLLADRQVIERRLRERAVMHAIQRLRGQDVPLFHGTFAMRKLDLCLGRLSQREFATQMRTDHLTVPQVAEAIAASAGLELERHRGSAIGARVRLASRGMRHALTR